MNNFSKNLLLSDILENFYENSYFHNFKISVFSDDKDTTKKAYEISVDSKVFYKKFLNGFVEVLDEKLLNSFIEIYNKDLNSNFFTKNPIEIN